MRFAPFVMAFALAGLLPAAPALAKLPPLRDPVFLNIGFVCKWQTACIERQQKAMKRALSFVKTRKPPSWKIQQCNRNASRFWGRERVDWVGFERCIRNPKIVRRFASLRRR